MSDTQVKEEPAAALFKDKKVVDFYKINEHVNIVIFKDKERYFYHPIEPVLVGREARVYSEAREILPRLLRVSIRFARQKPEDLRISLGLALDRVLRLLGENIPREGRDKIAYYLYRDFFGYGPVDPMYNDPFIEDITCSGPRTPVYVYHMYYEWLPTTVYFTSEQELTNFARKLAYRAGQELVFASPIVEGPLPPKDFRVHLTLDVVSRRGTTFAIRRTTEEPLTILDLIRLKTLTYEAAAYLWLLVSHRATVLIGGPMASGKTTLLNAISLLIPPNKKIVTIEETPELRLFHDNWTSLVTKPSSTEGIREVSLFDLLKSSLRQRADYIIVGEIRGEEAYTLLQAVAVGHGAMSTIHAESFEHVIRRLQSPPMSIPKFLLSLIDTVVIIRRYRRDFHYERRVTDIVDIVDYDPVSDYLNSTKTYSYDVASDRFFMAASSGTLTKLSRREGVPEKDLLEDYENRKKILKYLVEKGRATTFREFAKVITDFYLNPERLIEEAQKSA